MKKQPTGLHVPQYHLKEYKSHGGMIYLDLYWKDSGIRRRKSMKTKNMKAAEFSLHTNLDEILKSQISWHKNKYENDDVKYDRSKCSKAIAEIVEWYINTFCKIHRLGDRSISKYKWTLNRFLAFCEENKINSVENITTNTINELLVWYDKFPGRNTKHCSTRTIRANLTIIKSMLKEAHNAGIIDEIPVTKWPQLRKSKKEKDYAASTLTKDELNNLLDLLNRSNKDLWNLSRFMSYTGMRISDVIDLRWKEIDYNNGCIDRIQTKTGTPVKIPLTHELDQCFNYEKSKIKVIDLDSTVFRNRETPWTYRTALRQLKEFSPHSFHVFRKTFGALSANGTPPMPIKILQNLMGHTDVKTTLQYYNEVTVDDMRYWSEEFARKISK